MIMIQTWVSADSGALPLSRKFSLPPRMALSLLNTRAERMGVV